MRKTMGWKSTLREVLQGNNQKAARSAKAVSFATQALRREVLEKGFRDIHELGYKLQDVRGFKERHMKALAQAWEDQGKSPATIQNRISIFRIFSEWIGKKGMIQKPEKYVQEKENAVRQIVTNIDKTWSGQEKNLSNKLDKLKESDPFVAIQLELQRAFALRMKEASLLKPHLSDKVHYLTVDFGTKGGRRRTVEIKNEYQRDVLERAKSMLKDMNQSMTPKKYNFLQWRNHYYYVCRENGISRKDGITSHGLRHERLNERYKEITGQCSPVKKESSRNVIVDRSKHEFAKEEIAQMAGHSRPSIANVYIGKK